LIKEIVVASGKGGTGKTFISSNLAYLIHSLGENIIAVDADVEAPDLILALGGEKKRFWTEDYYGSFRPVVDYSKCAKCWKCLNYCRFGAIKKSDRGPLIDYSKCEGFGVCAVVCPSKAISLTRVKTGVIYMAESESGIKVITGDLELGGGSSGRLVYELKQRSRKFLKEGYVVVDSAPGIGCPVISSISGADLLVIAIEPTPQSIKGACRLLEVARSLRVKAVSVVNKYDLNPAIVDKIESMLEVEVVGRIPYSDEVVESYTAMTPLLATKSSIKETVEEVLNKILGEVP